MTFARQPDGERTAVLRPQNVELAVRRFDEWRAVHEAGETPERADALWVEMLREQGWSFEGFLDKTAKVVLGHDGKERTSYRHGDLVVQERKFDGWRRASAAKSP